MERETLAGRGARFSTTGLSRAWTGQKKRRLFWINQKKDSNRIGSRHAGGQGKHKMERPRKVGGRLLRSRGGSKNMIFTRGGENLHRELKRPGGHKPKEKSGRSGWCV